MTKYVLFLLLILFSVLNAKIIKVPDDYSLIQDAIDAAQVNDTVLVAPGEYYEDFTINKYITLASKFILSGDIRDVDSTILLGEDYYSGDINSGFINSFFNMSTGAIIGFTLGETVYSPIADQIVS